VGLVHFLVVRTPRSEPHFLMICDLSPQAIGLGEKVPMEGQKFNYFDTEGNMKEMSAVVRNMVSLSMITWFYGSI